MALSPSLEMDFMGVDKSKSNRFPMVFSWLINHVLVVFRNGMSPPLLMLSFGSIILSMSIIETRPKPWHLGQAPFGELKEKLLGSGCV